MLADPARSVPSPRIGLVLGAGGATGVAFHAGTLLALQHDLGWDPNSADVIVGSSAGSIVGGLLRAGLTTDDLSAWGASVDAQSAGRASRAVLDSIRAAPHRLHPCIPRVRLPSRTMWRSIVHPSRVRMHTAVLALLPHGWIDAAANIEQVGNCSTAGRAGRCGSHPFEPQTRPVWCSDEMTRP